MLSEQEIEMIQQAEREACEKLGIPFCEIHQRGKTVTSWGSYECESCGWEAQRIVEEGKNA